MADGLTDRRKPAASDGVCARFRGSITRAPPPCRGSSIMSVNAKKKETLDCIFHSQGYTDYKWIDPTQIVVAQWVRMKCMFGCDEYGRGGTCSTPRMSPASPGGHGRGRLQYRASVRIPYLNTHRLRPEDGSLRLSHGTLIRKIQEERPCPTSPFKPANPWKRPPPKI